MVIGIVEIVLPPNSFGRGASKMPVYTIWVHIERDMSFLVTACDEEEAYARAEGLASSKIEPADVEVTSIKEVDQF